MIDNNPITPPPELVQQWLTEPEYAGEMVSMTERRLQEIADKAALRGADQELEACCEWLVDNDWAVPGGKCLRDLRAARRPKPPSLKEQALEALDEMNAPLGNVTASRCGIIRRAIESLPD